MVHSVKKGPFVDEHLMRKVEAQEGSKKKQIIKTWSHRSAIFLNLVRHTFTVYGGRKRVPVHTTEDMVDHKLGGSAPIRIFKGHVIDDKKTRR